MENKESTLGIIQTTQGNLNFGAKYACVHSTSRGIGIITEMQLHIRRSPEMLSYLEVSTIKAESEVKIQLIHILEIMLNKT